MPAITPFQYHSDESLFGSGQYMTLKEIIDAMVLKSMDDDDYLKNTKRSQLIAHAKNGIKSLTADVASDILPFEITVPESLVVVVPQDYVAWVRVSVFVTDIVTGSKRLKELDRNQNISTAIAYLQDNDAEILFDNDGGILTADANNAYGQPYKKYCFVDAGEQFNLDTSKLSEYGEFAIDERGGKMVFSSDLSGKDIVVEYVSNGLQALTYNEQEITIHVYLEEALKSYIYYNCISGRRTVPANEKKRAKDELKGKIHKAKLLRMELDLTEVSRIMRQKSMNK